MRKSKNSDFCEIILMSFLNGSKSASNETNKSLVPKRNRHLDTFIPVMRGHLLFILLSIYDSIICGHFLFYSLPLQMELKTLFLTSG